MKRSTVITIIVIFLCIIAGGILGFYFYLNSKSAQLNTFGREVVTGNGFGTLTSNGTSTVSGNASTTQPELPPVAQQSTSTTTPKIPLLRHIHFYPVAGMGYFMKDIFATTTAQTETVTVANGTSTASSTRVVQPAQSKLIARIEVMEYMDRGNGHIYETASTTLGYLKISNTTVPKVYEAFFSAKNSVVLRDLINDSDIIRTRFGTQKLLSATSTDPVLTLQDLPAQITNLTLSPNKSKMFYIQKGSPTGIISNADGSGTVTAFDSPFKEWLVQWPNEKTLVITTKASANVAGYAYKIDVNTKNMQKLIGGIDGLTTLMSPNGEKLLYSKSENGLPNLYSLDIKTGRSTDLYLRTFPEKCVWSTKEAYILYCGVPTDLAITNYPDVWYQGRITFNDTVWRVNAKTSETRLYAVLQTFADEPIDIINPMLNPSEDYLMFQNKADLSLWGLMITKF